MPLRWHRPFSLGGLDGGGGRGCRRTEQDRGNRSKHTWEPCCGACCERGHRRRRDRHDGTLGMDERGREREKRNIQPTPVKSRRSMTSACCEDFLALGLAMGSSDWVRFEEGRGLEDGEDGEGGRLLQSLGHGGVLTQMIT